MRVFQVDSFTNELFKGNPAGVCMLVEDGSDWWMQNMAREMNLSETAFLKEVEDGYELRWFTPTTEVDLCGHATLAAAHTLWESGELAPDQEATFFTRSGVLRAVKMGDWIQLDFPLEEDEEVDPPQELVDGLGVPFLYVGKNRMDYLVEVESETVLRSLKPNMETLTKLANRGVMVTCQPESDEFDFVSRFFAPALGIDEDPVTGSAHCCLGPYWRRKLGKDEFTAYQASKRGGILQIKVDDRVYIRGQARTVFSGIVHGECRS
ncbi:MAG TPA: PhzF family phenazine biosynthesis protein [Limnochordia bacterium]|nr:PhzF family phenazine biosynthesis protein [Limnochordia bacterium]